MATIYLDGKITEQGQLEVGLPAGQARVTIEVPMAAWTSEELEKAMRVEPLTGAEIIAAGLTGGWKDEVAETGAEWVERRRRDRREQREW